MGQWEEMVWFGGGEKWEANSGVLAQAHFGEMCCWDDIPPKIGKNKLESLGACYRN